MESCVRWYRYEHGTLTSVALRRHGCSADWIGRVDLDRPQYLHGRRWDSDSHAGRGRKQPNRFYRRGHHGRATGISETRVDGEWHDLGTRRLPRPGLFGGLSAPVGARHNGSGYTLREPVRQEDRHAPVYRVRGGVL